MSANYADSSEGETARELAAAMHADSVNLWNRFWHEAGASGRFPQRKQVEEVQRLLSELAYPAVPMPAERTVAASEYLKGRVSRAQLAMIKSYANLDPEAQLLGFHRNRPVLYTHTSSWEPRKRHVVMVKRNAEPGDLSENWEDYFEFLPEGIDPGTGVQAPSAPTVRAVVRDWLSWSVRS